MVPFCVSVGLLQCCREKSGDLVVLLQGGSLGVVGESAAWNQRGRGAYLRGSSLEKCRLGWFCHYFDPLSLLILLEKPLSPCRGLQKEKELDKCQISLFQHSIK